VIRSDVGEAHRLSLSARVLSAVARQVKRNNNRRSASAACGISPPRTPGPLRPKPSSASQIPAKPPFYPGNIWGEHLLRLYIFKDKAGGYRTSLSPPRSDAAVGRGGGVVEPRSSESMERRLARVESSAQRFALTPRRHHHHHRRRQPDRPPHAACGFDRPRVFDTCHWPRAAWYANHVRSPCRLKSR
jgi:hypothetical protein